MTGSFCTLSLLSNLHPSRLFVSSSCSMPSPQDQRQCARGLLPLLAWLCAALSLRYGYYGGRQLLLGPNSSRMMKTSSLFVEQLRVAAGGVKQGLLLYGFNERPQLSVETNWTFSNHFFVDTYSRQGFSMWLNQGSRIWMDWKVAYGGGESNADMLLVLIKGEKNIKELERNSTSPHIDLIQQSKNGSKAEHMIEEANMYYIGVFNPTPRSIVMNMSISVASRTYDTRKATSICSTGNGECKLKLPFPSTQYYVLATSDSEVPLKLWSIQLSFVARWTAYFVITVIIVVVVSLILKQIGACNCEQPALEHAVEETAPAPETEPILPRKEMGCSAYGAIDEEEKESSAFSSQDLYDGKICVICYDQRRDCFFTPCGHCVTCCSCAQRIMQEENKICPICRRLIHKARRFPSP